MPPSTPSNGGAQQPWSLKDFSRPDFDMLDPSEAVEEETLPGYMAERYYPTRIGELIASRYQVVGKLGFGASSTVWLARDIQGRRYVALKIFIRSSSWGSAKPQELPVYARLTKGPPGHHGRSAIRPLLGSFTLSGPDGEHQVLVHTPLWDNLRDFLARNPIGRLPTPLLALTLRQVFRALDYAQECQVIHTDIKADNIMFAILEPAVFENFELAELEDPTPRKEVDGRFIYLSRELEAVSANSVGLPVLCDFGAAAWSEERNVKDVQPDVYRSPEVILKVPWSHEIDIWNVGCMIWDIYEGRHLFYGIDPEHGVYRGRAHLAEIIALLGPPPPEFVAQGLLRHKFFSEQGEFEAGVEVPQPVSLEQMETNLTGSDKRLFLQLMRKMLHWDPKKRYTAKQLLEDEWIKRHAN